MKFVDSSTGRMSAAALAAIQSRLAGHHSIALWPKDLFEAPYSFVKWPHMTLHKLRDPAHVKGVLVDHADCFEKSPFAKGLLQPVMGAGLVTSEGDRWRLQRSITSPAFRKSAINVLTPMIARAAIATSESFASTTSDAIEVLPQMFRLSFEVIRYLSFGASADAGLPFDETVRQLRVCLNGMSGNNVNTLEGASENLRSMATEAINRRIVAEEAGSDLFSLLHHATQASDDPLSNTEFRDNILTFISAGYDTTAVAASWALYLLATHLHIQEDVAAEVLEAFPNGNFTAEVEKLPLLRKVIMETMRLFPPVPSVSRIAVKPIAISGVEFSVGDTADILIYPMHRHKLLWRDPDAFLPDRFDDSESRLRPKFAYIPFGAGPRICIGSQLSYLQIALILATILRAHNLSAVDGYDPKPHVRVTLQPQDGLPLHFKPRTR